MAIGGIGNGAPAPNNVQNQQAPGNAGQNNNGVIAKGVGVLSRVWLRLTASTETLAGRHTQQLTNLRAEIRNEFGANGLRALNNTIQNRHLDDAGSTKLFSSSDLDTLRGQTEFDVRVENRISEMRTFSGIHNDPQFKALTMNACQRAAVDETFDALELAEPFVNGTHQPTADNAQTFLDFAQDYVQVGSQNEINISDNLRGRMMADATALQNAVNGGHRPTIDAAANVFAGHFHEMKGALQPSLFDNLRNQPAYQNAVAQLAKDQVTAEITYERLEEAGMIRD
ncbi:hypothetical protein LPB41_15675 [Thalassospira sp. MA62]|nr:hypothetical protein [Thalassospira sp. MA62]